MENQIGSSTSGVYYLKWKGYGVHLTNRISNLLQEEQFADVTLACDGNYIRAHKLLLSLCSPYFKKLFEIHSPEKSNTIVILNHVRFHDLESILSFVYTGQVHVHQSDLNSFLQTGELLQIEGLANSSDDSNNKSASFTTSSSAQDYLTDEFPTNPTSQSNGSTSCVQPVTTELNRPAQSSYTCGSDSRGTNHSQSSTSSASNKRFKSSSSSSHRGVQPQAYFSSQQQIQARTSPIVEQLEANDQRNCNNVMLRSPPQNIEEDPLADSCSRSMTTFENDEQQNSNCHEDEVNLGILKTETLVIDIKDSDDDSPKDSHRANENDDHQGFLSNLLVETREAGCQEREGFDFYTESAAAESPIATTSGSLPVEVASASSVFEVPKVRSVNRVVDSSLVEENIPERSDILSPGKLDTDGSRNYSSSMRDSQLRSGSLKIEDLDEDETEVEVLQLGSKPLVAHELKANSCGFGGAKVGRRSNSENFARQNPNFHPYAMSVAPVSLRPSPAFGATLGVGIRMVGPAQVHIEFVRCNVCNEEVAKYALRDHVLKVHCNDKDSEMRAPCPICFKNFKNKNSLKVHKSMYHRNRGSKPPSSSSLSSDESQFPSFNMEHDQHY